MQVTSIHEGCAYIRGKFEDVLLQEPIHRCSESQGVALLLSVAPPTANRGLFRFARRKGTNQSHTKNTNRDCLQSQNIQAGKYCKSRSNVLKKLLSTGLRKLVTPTPAYKKKPIYTTPYRHKGKNECAKPKEQQITRLATALEDDSRNFQSIATVYLPACTTNLRTLITIYYIRPLIHNK